LFFNLLVSNHGVLLECLSTIVSYMYNFEQLGFFRLK